MTTETYSLKLSDKGAPALVFIDNPEDRFQNIYQAVLVWPFPGMVSGEQMTEIAHWKVHPNSSVEVSTIFEVLLRKAVFKAEELLKLPAADRGSLETEEIDNKRFRIDRTAGAYACLDSVRSFPWLLGGLHVAFSKLPQPLFAPVDVATTP